MSRGLLSNLLLKWRCSRAPALCTLGELRRHSYHVVWQCLSVAQKEVCSVVCCGVCRLQMIVPSVYERMLLESKAVQAHTNSEVHWELESVEATVVDAAVEQ